MSVFDPLLRASASDRWINCPASASVPDTPFHGPAAERGSAAHQVAAELIYLALTPEQAASHFETMGKDKVRGFNVTFEEVREPVMRYVMHVAEMRKARPNATFYVEHSLHKILQAKVDSDVGGTADLIVHDGDELILIDFKSGFKEVRAEDNYQLLTYLLGAYYLFGMAAVTFKAAIFQPTGPSGVYWVEYDYTVADLMVHLQRVRKAANAARRKNPPHKPGAWCDYCPKAHRCQSLRRAVGHVVKVATPLVPGDPQKLGALAHQLPMIKAMVKAVEAVMKEIVVERKQEVPGFKMVDGVNRRKWAREMKETARCLREAGLKPEDIFELKSPAKIEVAIGNRHKALQLFDKYDMISVQRGNPTWAPVTDRRATRVEIKPAETSEFSTSQE